MGHVKHSVEFVEGLSPHPRAEIKRYRTHPGQKGAQPALAADAPQATRC